MRNIDQQPPARPLLGNHLEQGMDWGRNQQPFSAQDHAQQTKPHWPEQETPHFSLWEKEESLKKYSGEEV